VARILRSRGLRLLVLLAAFGVGGVAGAPVMGLPPRAGVTISGGGGDDDPPDGGGGDDDNGSPVRPPAPRVLVGGGRPV
jgi:hypothetical protein